MACSGVNKTSEIMERTLATKKLEGGRKYHRSGVGEW